MRFYELPPEVEKKICDTDARPFVRIVLELSGGDVYIPDSDILECVATSYNTEAGGIVNCGELLLKGIYDNEKNPEYVPGLGVQIWYCFGDRTNTFFRFHMFVDDSGFQSQETGFLDKTTKVHLIDLSTKLDDTKLQRNWTDAQTVVHSVVCDRLQPEKSLVHIIAARGGFVLMRLTAALYLLTFLMLLWLVLHGRSFVLLLRLMTLLWNAVRI
ncbi:hypothetical protein [Treponema sp. Marseille-Q3903]|uniref:hypothetical protein n=1 Tax=Treponema sp. Marseille-Q3903 TaxID=2766703 RepID=UPI00165249D9|nr:hypothetical protein [Treponema sp. Marseille-Q3903]MBC6712445.1 hypothetical protein [Treponema sp. Marseille-Q3903]